MLIVVNYSVQIVNIFGFVLFIYLFILCGFIFPCLPSSNGVFFVNIFNPSIHPFILPLQFIQPHCVTLVPLMQFMRMTIVISLLNYPLNIPIFYVVFYIISSIL